MYGTTLQTGSQMGLLTYLYQLLWNDNCLALRGHSLQAPQTECQTTLNVILKFSEYPPDILVRCGETNRKRKLIHIKPTNSQKYFNQFLQFDKFLFPLFTP